MRYLCFVMALTFILLKMEAQAGDQLRQPSTQPVRPSSKMTAELTGPVSLQGEIPITLTLFSESDGEHRYNNYSFMFVLLDENGHQIGGPHVFIREANIIELKVDGKEFTYKPQLMFYRERKGLVVGRKYQLVCLMPPCDLAGAVWFTLTE